MLIERKKLILVGTCTASLLASSGVIMAEATTETVEERLSALENKQSNSLENWVERVNITGLIEVEASYDDPERGSSSSDLVVATAELAITGTINDSVFATVTLLYEEDDSGLDVDVANLTYAPKNSPFSAVLGQDYLPFGAYETALINDPLSLEIGETRETAITAYYQNEYLKGAIYFFNGDQDEGGNDVINSFGTSLSVGSDNYSIGLDYTNNIADSDGLQENDYGYAAGEDNVAAATLYGSFSAGAFTVVGEYLTVLDELAVDGLNSEPSAAQVELIFNHDATTYAASYQKTDEALFLELPETRISVGVSREISDGVGLALQLQRDEDYKQSEGGSGDGTNSAVIQLSAEF